jgi:hypothetical protein
LDKPAEARQADEFPGRFLFARVGFFFASPVGKFAGFA